MTSSAGIVLHVRYRLVEDLQMLVDFHPIAIERRRRPARRGRSVPRAVSFLAMSLLHPMGSVAFVVERRKTGESRFRIHADRIDRHSRQATLRALLTSLIDVLQRRSVTALRSNVYKTNRRSLAFHARLGFTMTRENEKGVQFTSGARMRCC